MEEALPASTLRRALCTALRDTASSVDWPSFTASDWRALLTLAQVDGVLPLLYRRLDTRGELAQIPPDPRRVLQLGYYAAVAQTGLLYQQLQRLLAALCAVTPVVVLKGAALGPALYPEPALRPLSDIDLLIPEGDLPAATAVLHSLGYAEVPELTPGINRLVEYHTRFDGGPGSNVTVEIHWRLVAGAADWRSPSQAWFWQQREPWQPASITGPTASTGSVPSTLTPTAHLIYLAAHLMLQHGGAGARLIWLYDLHLLIGQHGDRIQWDLAIKQASTFRWTAALHDALVATQAYFDTTLPEGVLNRLQALADTVTSTFIRRKATTAPTPTMSEWFKIMALEPRARVTFVLSLLWPSPAYIRWRYQPRPSRLWPLYYLFHWLRILHAGFHTLRHLRRLRPGQ